MSRNSYCYMEAQVIIACLGLVDEASRHVQYVTRLQCSRDFPGSIQYVRWYRHAIFADWGNKDKEDLLAAIDYLIEEGIADPDRLGLGGWSFGGILTNYIIASDGSAPNKASFGWIISTRQGHRLVQCRR